MIDIVIPLGKGSRWFDNELKYSLRSLERFGRNVGNVFVIGEKPEWAAEGFIEEHFKPERKTVTGGITHIPVIDKYNSQRNIHEKIKIACLNEWVSDDFLFWNDDFFLTDEIDCENYPYFHFGTLMDKINERIVNDGYRRAMEHTYNFLVAHELNTLYFDIHCPIIYNKEKYLELMKYVKWEVPNGNVIKSLYANYYEVPTAEMKDLKITADLGRTEMENRIKDRHIFSISDSVMMAPAKTMKIYLEETYNQKSKYER